MKTAQDLAAQHGDLCNVANFRALVWRATSITSGAIYSMDLVEFADGAQYQKTAKGFVRTR